jgi:hypothetical protein
MRQQYGSYIGVILKQHALRNAKLGPEELVEIRQADLPRAQRKLGLSKVRRDGNAVYLSVA